MKSFDEMLLKEYSSYLLSERNCSKETVGFYINDIKQFIEYMNGFKHEVIETGTDDIEISSNRLLNLKPSILQYPEN